MTVANTSVIGTGNTNSTLNPVRNVTYATVNPDRAVGHWTSNTVAATNMVFVRVRVPVQPGVAAPTIVVIDQRTFAVTYDGVTETNSFDPTYTGAYTYRVETLDNASNPGGAESPAPVRLIIGGGAVIGGGSVQ